MNTSLFSPLLFSPAFFAGVRLKCGEEAWSRKALEKLREQAESRWESPFDIPLLGGGWSHNYNCPSDGDRLNRLDRHHHCCPTCGSVWSGSPWDEVAVSHEHGYYSTGSRQMALLYGITGEERAAEWAKRVLLFYASHYEGYELHDRHGGASKTSGKVQCQTLSEASWLLPLTQAYYILKQHAYLSDSERQQIERQLLLPAASLVDRNPMEMSNWQTYHNAAKAWVAAAAGRSDLMEQAVHDPMNGFMFQMEHSLSDDGFWYEGAWGYHFYTLEAQVQLVLAAQLTGLPLHENARFQSMFRAPLQSMFPDGTLPPVHDSGTVNVNQYAPLFEFSSLLFGVGQEVVLASARDSVNSLLFGTPGSSDSRRTEGGLPAFAELKKAGMMFMKQAGSTAMIDYGEHGGYHGHRDKLSLLYYAGGHPWLSDAGMLPYGNAKHEAFFKQTAAHNTVALGGRSQAEAEGRLVKAEPTDDGWLRLVTETGQAYPGAMLRRHCVLTDRVLLDVYDVFCDVEQDVDWIIHTQGAPVLIDAGDIGGVPADGIAIGESDGYEFLKFSAAWRSSSWIRAWRWDDAKHSGDRFEVYGLALPDAAEEEVFLAESPAMPSIGKRSTLIRRRKSVKHTRFVTLFRACRDDDAMLQVMLADNGPGPGLTIQVLFPDGTGQSISIAE